MNGRIAKKLKKLAKLSGLPYKAFKKYYKDLNSTQRRAFIEEMEEVSQK